MAVAAPAAPARRTYLHSLRAHAAPRAAPPAESRPGPAGAAAAARQRRRALGHLAPKLRPRRCERRRPTRAHPARPTPRRALAPCSERAGLRGRLQRARGAARLSCASRERRAPRRPTRSAGVPRPGAWRWRASLPGRFPGAPWAPRCDAAGPPLGPKSPDPAAPTLAT